MKSKQVKFLDGPVKDSQTVILDDGSQPYLIVPFSSKKENGEREILYAGYKRNAQNEFVFDIMETEAKYKHYCDGRG